MNPGQPLSGTGFPGESVDGMLPQNASSLPEELETDPGTAGSYDPDLWLYRDRTVALLRRYFRISVEVGRLPSLLGREVFRARVTSYRVGTFEDAVIFVHDMEACLERLDDFERALIGKIALQEYSQDEAAQLLGCWRRTVGRRYPETLDKLSEILLHDGLLTRLPATPRAAEKPCQEGEIGENLLSLSEDGK
jgi:hypothetical protein